MPLFPAKNSGRPEPPGPIPGSATEVPPTPAKPSPDKPGTSGKFAQSAAMYHGPEQHCEQCSHFTSPSSCDIASQQKWPDAEQIDPGGWCKNFSASPDGDEGEGMEEPADGGTEPDGDEDTSNLQ